MLRALRWLPLEASGEAALWWYVSWGCSCRLLVAIRIFTLISWDTASTLSSNISYYIHRCTGTAPKYARHVRWTWFFLGEFLASVHSWCLQNSLESKPQAYPQKPPPCCVSTCCSCRENPRSCGLFREGSSLKTSSSVVDDHISMAQQKHGHSKLKDCIQALKSLLNVFLTMTKHKRP